MLKMLHIMDCDIWRRLSLIICLTVIVPQAILSLPIVPSNVRRDRAGELRGQGQPQVPAANQKPEADLKVKVDDLEVKGHKDGVAHFYQGDESDDMKVPDPVKKFKPPDHLDAVKLEQDGHLNHDFRKEVLLGEHETMEKDTPEQKAKRLSGIFLRVDKDADQFIDQKEIESWIFEKIREHFEQASKENSDVFKSLDPDGDDLISWEEFHTEFLVALGWSRKEAEDKARDPERAMEGLDSKNRDQLITNKFRWAEADDDNDNKLTLQEFKNFMHPEGSKKMMENMVRDILENLDKDNDGILGIDEFAALPGGELEEQFNTDEWKASDKRWQDERKREFREVIDTNKDGNVTKDELYQYVNPQNANNARQEAENLIAIADADKDGKLSLKEVLDNPDLFYGSKMMNAGRNFHDEF